MLRKAIECMYPAKNVWIENLGTTTVEPVLIGIRNGGVPPLCVCNNGSLPVGVTTTCGNYSRLLPDQELHRRNFSN